MITRRAFSKLSLSAAGAALAGPALAKTPFADAQVPGVFRRNVGDIQITALLDGYADLNASMFSDLEPAEMADILAQSAQDEVMPTAVNAFVINTGDLTILVDAGMGPSQMLGPDLGNVAANLAAAGIAPTDIDAIILTHAHPDHDGGLLNAEGAASFETAELIMAEPEHAFWMDDGALAQAPEAMQGLFASARASLAPYAARTTLIGTGEVFPGVHFELSPGHTPGHGILRISSSDQQILMLADTLHNEAIHLLRPEAGFAFDTDPALAASSRQRLFDEAATDQIMMAATHLSFPSFGRIVRSGDAYRHVPAEWQFPL